MRKRLQKLVDVQEYKRRRRDVTYWEPIAKEIASQFGIQDVVKMLPFATMPVFRLGTSYWLKLFSPRESHLRRFLLEAEALAAFENALSVKTPKIVHSGTIEGWNLLILSHVSGETIEHAKARFENRDWLIIAKQLGKLLQEIRSAQDLERIRRISAWEGRTEEQIKNVIERERRRGLAEPWLQNLPGFIERLGANPFAWSENPVMLHGDLHVHNILTGKKPDGDVTITGIIDFDRATVGHPEYDLGVPAIRIFQKNREAIAEFLNASGLAPLHEPSHWARLLTAWYLVNQNCNFYLTLKTSGDIVPVGDWEAFSKLYFPL